MTLPTTLCHRCTEGNVRAVGWFAATQYARSTASARATKQSPEWHLHADRRLGERSPLTFPVTLQAKKITPHTLRHTAAMNLPHAGVDITVIALWMGTKAPSPPASTCTPTWRSKKRRSHHPARHPSRTLPAARRTADLPQPALTRDIRRVIQHRDRPAHGDRAGPAAASPRLAADVGRARRQGPPLV